LRIGSLKIHTKLKRWLCINNCVCKSTVEITGMSEVLLKGFRVTSKIASWVGEKTQEVKNG